MKKASDYINLLPRDDNKSGKAPSRLTITISVFVFAWLLIFGWYGKQAFDLRSKLMPLEAKKQVLQQQLAALLKDLGIAMPEGTSPEKAWLIQNLLNERVLWSEVFKQFSTMVPRGLWFDSLEGSSFGKPEIRIRGGSFTYLTVSEFMLAMEKSQYFEKPQLIYARKSVMNGREIIGFEILSGVQKKGGIH
ncbi:MAG: PilN domain-containing protein [Nitrospirota bacterium]